MNVRAPPAPASGQARRYIADFAAPAARLIVEVDGGYHSKRSKVDRRRDRHLERVGYRTDRLPAALVMSNLAEALAQISACLAEIGTSGGS
jgi:very-short-patch-repair endonuclease